MSAVSSQGLGCFPMIKNLLPEPGRRKSVFPSLKAMECKLLIIIN